MARNMVTKWGLSNSARSPTARRTGLPRPFRDPAPQNVSTRPRAASTKSCAILDRAYSRTTHHPHREPRQAARDVPCAAQPETIDAPQIDARSWKARRAAADGLEQAGNGKTRRRRGPPLPPIGRSQRLQKLKPNGRTGTANCIGTASSDRVSRSHPQMPKCPLMRPLS